MTAERDWRGLLFVAPFLALYLLILVFPLLRGLWLSFYQVDLFGAGHFVGLGNYARLLHDPVFGTSLVNTFEVTLMIVPALTVISLLLALALNRAGKGAAIMRGIFFASAVLSVTIVTLIWRFVLAPDAGLLGEAWKALGWEPLPFLSDPDLVLPALAITTIWWSVGFPMLLFLAGLQQIPQDMYEAASLDGASRWRQFWKITLPLLTPVVFFNAIIQTIEGFKSFTPAFIISGGTGNPINSTLFYTLYLYQEAFGFLRMGYASALAWVLLAIIAVFTAFSFLTSRYWVHYED
jgi:multiple sugar transport system permease protein